MGAKTWMLVYAELNAREALKSQSPLDRDATQRLAINLFPEENLERVGDGSLSYTCPRNNELLIGCFEGISIVAAKEFAIDYPSRLPKSFIARGGTRLTYLHAMHSVVDWFAYAYWDNGEMVRSLSLSPDSGILEDIGQRLPFEEPYWSGRHPVDVDDETESYQLPFHPLELGEATLRELFGYQLEGVIDPALLEPELISLVRYRRSRSWWKFWR